MESVAIYLYMSAFFEDGARTWRLQLAENCGRVRFAPGWESGADWWRTLADFDLWFVWSGRGVMELEDRTESLSAGSCIWMRPGRRYVTRHDPARILGLTAEPEGRTSGDRLFAALLSELVREARHRAAAPGLKAEHVERIHAVMAEIQQAPARPVTVAALARRHGYSVSHFSRLFAAIAGRRPQAFVIEARLEQARERLAFTEESVGAIAAQCGFADIYYFSRLFRQRTGVPPTEYRRRLARS